MTESAAAWVRVAVAAPLPASLTYALPEALVGRVGPGHAVLVPLGQRLVSGWVLETLSEPDIPPEKIRAVARLVDPVPVVDGQQFAFLRWASTYYLSGLGDMLATSIPSAARARVHRVYLPEESAAAALAEAKLGARDLAVLREVVRRPGGTTRTILRELAAEMEHKEIQAALAELRRAGFVRGANREVGAVRDQTRVLRLLIQADQLVQRAPRAGAHTQAIVARVGEAGGSMDLPALLDAEGPSARSILNRLVEQGLATWETRERRERAPLVELGGSAVEPPAPNSAQKAALDAICSRKAGTFLLHGVTGSGKTEVYLQAASRVLASGRQVLVLVPEIALTPQLVGRFHARFGDDVVVLHSALTGVERLRGWRRVRANDARLAVGARSALFAPFRDLGLLVVDEEHDESYKQDDGVRYHARDLAVVRGRMAGCPVVLGSATPSLESLHNAAEGRYELLSLPERATPNAPPAVEIVNLNEEPRGADGQSPVLTERLVWAIQDALDAGGKAIVLHNRRGWATLVQCTTCGGSYSCPSCGISLVLHQKDHRLICHYCGYNQTFSDTCPVCKGTELEILGQGSERVADLLARRFPGIPVGRMDADTTAARGSHARILEDFRTGKTRLLVGTQLVAKGHDFPDVHVAAIVGVDHILALPDFRSAERTFSLVTQLAGRAGRGDRPGKVILQTRHPEHFVFRLLGNPGAFLAEELRHRHVLGYPPFSRLVLLRFEGVDLAIARDAARQAVARMRADLPEDRSVGVLGPVPAPLPRLVGRWRFQVVLRGRRFATFRTFVEAHVPGVRASVPRGVRLVVDVDPRSLM
jgi:primosomal protein N' (replication factor Y) (superfamily II helicase)